MDKEKGCCREENGGGEERIVRRAKKKKKKKIMKKKKEMVIYTRKEKKEYEEEEQEEEARRLTLCPLYSSQAANTHATGLFHPDAMLNEVLAGGSSRPYRFTAFLSSGFLRELTISHVSPSAHGGMTLISIGADNFKQ